MPKIYIDIDEWYPVYCESSGAGILVELTEEQIKNYRGVVDAFEYWQEVLRKKRSAILKEKRNAKIK